MRYTTPMNLWRNTSEDTAVGSYVIPKGTTITAQISLIMTDEKYFKNRNEFNPDRYLNGNKLDQKVVPFGLGKRSCLGESLAQAELYLVRFIIITKLQSLFCSRSWLCLDASSQPVICGTVEAAQVTTIGPKSVLELRANTVPITNRPASASENDRIYGPTRSQKHTMSLFKIIANILLRYNINADPSHMPSMKAMNDFRAIRKHKPYQHSI
ncbi:hypothetical protein COOONC_16895 [Cooperia oncophora]